jgi:hypothetical protein
VIFGGAGRLREILLCVALDTSPCRRGRFKFICWLIERDANHNGTNIENFFRFGKGFS